MAAHGYWRRPEWVRQVPGPRAPRPRPRLRRTFGGRSAAPPAPRGGSRAVPMAATGDTPSAGRLRDRDFEPPVDAHAQDRDPRKAAWASEAWLSSDKAPDADEEERGASWSPERDGGGRRGQGGDAPPPSPAPVKMMVPELATADNPLRSSMDFSNQYVEGDTTDAEEESAEGSRPPGGRTRPLSTGAPHRDAGPEDGCPTRCRRLPNLALLTMVLIALFCIAAVGAMDSVALDTDEVRNHEGGEREKDTEGAEPPPQIGAWVGLGSFVLLCLCTAHAHVWGELKELADDPDYDMKPGSAAVHADPLAAAMADPLDPDAKIPDAKPPTLVTKPADHFLVVAVRRRHAQTWAAKVPTQTISTTNLFLQYCSERLPVITGSHCGRVSEGAR